MHKPTESEYTKVIRKFAFEYFTGYSGAEGAATGCGVSVVGKYRNKLHFRIKGFIIGEDNRREG